MEQQIRRNFELDPRIELIILMIINVCIFTTNSSRITDIWCVFLAILLFGCGYKKTALKAIIIYVFLLCIQTYIFPIASKIFIMIFSIFVNYTRKIFPCIMIGIFIVKTTTMKKIVLALRKMHVSEKFIIPVSVTIRYFPAIIEEIRNIKDAMKLRKIPILQKIECMIIPLMISAINIADELAAAAVTRGIENPCKKTSLEELHFRPFDFICLLISIGILFTVNIL